MDNILSKAEGFNLKLKSVGFYLIKFQNLKEKLTHFFI